MIQENAGGWTTPAGLDLEEAVAEYGQERAAIMEFCAGLTRAEAERRARAEAWAYREMLMRVKK